MSSPTQSAAIEAEQQRPRLSNQRIVSTALRFIDENCLTELSMRRLGAELGVEAMSLYRYFPSKAALLDATVCQVLGRFDLPEGTETDWEEAVRAYARSFHEVASEHPRLFPFLATSAETNGTLRDVADRMRAMWLRAGLDQQTADHAQATVESYVTGANLRAVSGDTSRDAAFEFGLDALIDGLRARLGPMVR